jgi:hypothetical protein
VYVQPQAAAERKRAGGTRKAGSKANLSGMDAGAGEGAWARQQVMQCMLALALRPLSVCSTGSVIDSNM